ncbi:MAG TPA: hypothetical protein VH008_16820 [Pseudonocardia sp.]|nr:hypothetical protein [Pseudonocardia sp.]
MDTWGRRGFAAAVITGGMIGLSGAGTGGVPSAQWGGVPEQEPRAPRRQATGPATRYAAPEYQAPEYQVPEYQPGQRAAAEYRPAEVAERTVATQTVATQVQPEQPMPRHATPSYAAAQATGEYSPAEYQAADYQAAEYRAAEYPTGGMARVPAGAGTHGVHGSDGFLAGNLAALASPPSVPAAGTPIGALGPAEGSLGTGFSSYRNTAAPAEFGRPESRHARPEQPELYADRPLESYGDRYADRPAESYPGRVESFGEQRPADSFGERPRESYGDRPAELYGDRPAELYGDRPAELYGERPVELYGDRGAELYGERPVELYGDHGAELYGERSRHADSSRHTDSQTVAMTPRSPIQSMSQPAVPTGQSMQQPPVHQQMGMPMSYPAERPVRAVELVGAAHQQGGNRHAAPVDSDTSALGSLDSSALFGSLSRPPR